MQQSVTFAIAEDELIESQAMRHFIESHFPEARVLWQEEDGERALAAVRSEPPQVLIVDIHMPVMDGLTMCEQLAQDGYDGVILINTAFDSFAYAKRAIALKAFDYIVKPVDNDSLHDALQSCIQEAQRRAVAQAQHRDVEKTLRSLGQLAVSLLAKGTQNPESSQLCLDTLGWFNAAPAPTRALHIVSPTAFAPERIRALEQMLAVWPGDRYLVASDFIDDHHMIALIKPRVSLPAQMIYTQTALFAQLLTHARDTFVSVSEPCDDALDIARACTSNPTAFKNPLTMPPRTWRTLQKKDAEKLRKTIERYFFGAQFARAERALLDAMRSDDDPQLRWETVHLAFSAAMHVWPEQDFMPAAAPLFHPDTDVAAYISTLLRFCAALPAPNVGDVIERALDTIRTQYDTDISQSVLAESLGLEQGYFCRLFKKKTGRNFSEVLMDTRMQHAEALLRKNPRISLEELCNACGLTSKTYFSEAFKKWKGMTITQFIRTLPQP